MRLLAGARLGDGVVVALGDLLAKLVLGTRVIKLKDVGMANKVQAERARR